MKKKKKENLAKERKADSCGVWAFLNNFHSGKLNPLDANTTLLTLNITNKMEEGEKGGSKSLLAK